MQKGQHPPARSAILAIAPPVQLSDRTGSRLKPNLRQEPYQTFEAPSNPHALANGYYYG